MIVAVIPIKGLPVGKSRLSPYLPAHERKVLVMKLAGRTVAAVRESGMVETVAVVTPDPATAAVLGTEFLPDAGDLNSSLQSAAVWAGERGAAGLLILPCDLPLVTTADVQAVVSEGAGVTIAPTHDGGTGALCLSPPQSIPPRFGEGSFARHVLSARERGVPVHEVHRPGLRYDLDTVEDLRHFDDELRAV
jgi:2-phospho-L-lactate guanylyltransferase